MDHMIPGLRFPKEMYAGFINFSLGGDLQMLFIFNPTKGEMIHFDE